MFAYNLGIAEMTASKFSGYLQGDLRCLKFPDGGGEQIGILGPT